MDNNPHEKIPKVVILQRICPSYRIALFSKLTSCETIDIQLLIGDDVPNTKIKSASDLSGVRHKKLRTKFINLFGRILVLHLGLIRKLKAVKPDVILCEADSHFLGYIKAIFYRTFINRNTKLLYWCFIELPGRPNERSIVHALIKKITRSFFDGFVLYSTFSKDALVKRGYDPESMFIATNVGDTEQHLKNDKEMTLSSEQAKEKLNLPNKFTVLYLGTLDPNKHPNRFLDIAGMANVSDYNFVLLGSGPMLEPLRERVEKDNLLNVYLPGRVTAELPLYMRASDTLLVPGLGGIVVSEAMAYGVLPMVYQADGTEYDLLKADETGVFLQNNKIATMFEALEKIKTNPKLQKKMGAASRKMIANKCTTENMANQIIAAIVHVCK